MWLEDYLAASRIIVTCFYTVPLSMSERKCMGTYLRRAFHSERVVKLYRKLGLIIPFSHFNTGIHEGLFCSYGERVVKSRYLYRNCEF